MSIKILTKNSIDNTNIDGARQNHFSAGMRSGIVRGAFNEGRFFASASNVIALDSCELRISGHQIVIDSIEAITLSDRPSVPTKYSMIAEIQVSDMSVPSFRLFIQPASVGLRQENLFKTNNGSGTYQLRIGNFTLGTTGLISDVVRTADIITGGGEGGIADIKFNATATQLSSSSQPEVNADYNEETKEWDLNFGIPAGSGSRVTIGGVEQPTWSADFAESERQKSKNLFDIGNIRGYIGNVVTSINGNEITISNSTGWGQISYTVYVNPNTDYVLSVQDINVITQSVGTGKIGIYRGSDNSYITEISPLERTQTFNSGAETQIRVYLTSTAWGVEGSGKAKYTGIQIEEGTVATDYQPYNGTIVHEKQLKEAVDKRELFYDVLNNRIDITNSTLTTLQAYFDLFKSDTSKIYTCNIGGLETSKFKDLLPSVGLGNYCSCYIKHYSNGLWGDGRLEAFEIVAFEQFGQSFAKGYLYKNLNDKIVFTGWAKIGG